MIATRIERAIVTGAGGFVGHALVSHLEASATRLRIAGEDWLEQVRTADFRGSTVFHLAARAHAQDSSEAELMRDNVDKTRMLALAAAAGGARRFVFLSSAKVNGEESRQRPFRPTDSPAPEDAYGRSKAEAEAALAKVAGMEIVVVRAPLVYGPAVKGNLLALLHLADSPWPLPFGAIANRRSFVHVDDLARLLIDCAVLPRAVGGVFFAAHSQSVSTSALVAAIRANLERRRRLVKISPRLLEILATFTGQGGRMRRLTRSLEVDASDTREKLGWTAQIGVEPAVEDMVRAYRETPDE